jgi:uncharacterized protein (DUF305 family)
MENKNNIVLFSLVFLVVGIVAGSLLFSNCCIKTVGFPNGMHMMSNGQMMPDNYMDMKDMMESMTKPLEKKTGDDFDKEFIEEMIVHHEGAVAMAELVLAKSNRPELKQLATDIISAQTKEIQMMQNWLKEWFK